MGDRIAVMRDGLLQQIGTPEQVYTQPANTFVATFIGSPAMNVLPAPVLGLGAIRCSPASAPSTSTSGRGRTAPSLSRPRSRSSSNLGDERLAHLRLGEFSLVAKLPVDQHLEPGTAAAFSVAREAVSFFAAETGAATDSPS